MVLCAIVPYKIKFMCKVQFLEKKNGEKYEKTVIDGIYKNGWFYYINFMPEITTKIRAVGCWGG